MLWFPESNCGKRGEEDIPILSISLWLQFFLDSLANVDEAVTVVRDDTSRLVSCITATC